MGGNSTAERNDGKITKIGCLQGVGYFFGKDEIRILETQESRQAVGGLSVHVRVLSLLRTSVDNCLLVWIWEMLHNTLCYWVPTADNFGPLRLPRQGTLGKTHTRIPFPLIDFINAFGLHGQGRQHDAWLQMTAATA